jgi:hypothetical protein
MPVIARSRAVVLAIVFLLGSYGLPAFDALAFHRGGADPGIGQPHFEAAGTSCGHSDRCVLGITLPGPRIVNHVDIGQHFCGLLESLTSPTPPSTPRAESPSTLAQPRAPPGQLA